MFANINLYIVASSI